MHRISLPISKSIANRLLILQAIHGDEHAGSPTKHAVSWGAVMPVSADMPDDVLLLHHALTTLHHSTQFYTTLNLSNCGTAMRFLTAYCAQLGGQTTILDGIERMHHRPIGQLVDALREIGAQIEYVGEEGFPPLRITGCALDKHKLVRIDNPLSTQFVSALMLIGANVQTDSTSPYITLTHKLIQHYTTLHHSTRHYTIEKDWSSAAFWYEYVALHASSPIIELPGLYRDSLQGDKVVADIFAKLGVQTQYTAEGITIFSTGVADLQQSDLQGIIARSTAQRSAEETILNSKFLIQNFSACPDLYPAVALTCERLGITLHATGTESLSIKESDRIRAVREHLTDHDHRMVMALLVAGYPVDDTDCISKSYPRFLEQWQAIQTSSPENLR